MRTRLLSCQVTNFRSVKDSEFFNFSVDNITAIIGQNESGKTSILEALSSFASGKLDPDVLRSEDVFPAVTCVFGVTPKWFEMTFEGYELPRGLKKQIKDAGNKISLTRTWSSPTEEVVTMNFLNLDELFAPKPAPEPPQASDNDTEKTKSDENPVAAADAKPPEATTPELKSLTAKQFVSLVMESLPEFQKFEDFESLLPDTIDLDDVLKANKKAEGYKGVMNLLELMDLDVSKLKDLSEKFRKTKLTEKNRTFTAEFQKYWRQKIGNRDKVQVELAFEKHDDTDGAKAGKPYLSFWIVENENPLRPKQRSKGLRWFLSFFLQLNASSKRSNDQRDLILLIDEPAGSLHARAQEDVLAVFDTLKKNIQVIYTTHTQYLLDLDKLYRIIAAQRETVNGDDYSLADTRLFGAHKLGAASTDTLTPLFDSMGSSLAGQNVIDRTNNIIVEEVSAHYYLKALLKLKNMEDVHLLPTNGTSNIPQLARLLLGWGIEFGILTDDEPRGKKILEDVKKELFPSKDSNDYVDTIFRVLPGCTGIEDLFSKTDFAKFIVGIESKEIAGANSAYVNSPQNKKSKGLLAVKFYNAVHTNGDEQLTFDKLDKTTQKNLNNLAKIISEMMAAISSPPKPIMVDNGRDKTNKS